MFCLVNIIIKLDDTSIINFIFKKLINYLNSNIDEPIIDFIKEFGKLLLNLTNFNDYFLDYFELLNLLLINKYYLMIYYDYFLNFKYRLILDF